MGKDKVLALLEAADWNDIILRLTYYAIWQARRYNWRSGNPKQLPRGKTPGDIAYDAIEKVWSGTRNWDPDRHPNLLEHLKWIVKSDIEHLFSSMEHRKTCRTPVSRDDEKHGESYSKMGRDAISSMVEMPLTPEEELIAEENRMMEEKLKEELYSAVKGDEDLEMLLLCFEEGIEKPEAIAAQTGWHIKKVYNEKRKLFRIAAKVGKTFDKST